MTADQLGTKPKLMVCLVAGEPSGDILGARLMAALRAQWGDTVGFVGVGGEAMIGAGLKTFFSMSELSVMGLAEVLPHLRHLRRRLDDTEAAIHRIRPDVVVTIDSPGFTLRLQSRLLGMGIPRVHYVAPQVWAWKPWRARTLGRKVDCLLTLFPFEPSWFTPHGLPSHFVGHPVTESSPAVAGAAAFRRDHDIPSDAALLCVLPGSRKTEITRLLPVFEATVRRLAVKRPDLRITMPTLPDHAEILKRATAAWPVPVHVTCGEESKTMAFAAADAALAASGTVTLELAVAGVPTVVAYRLHPVTVGLARPFVRGKYASLANILLNRPAQPEFLLGACKAKNLVPAVVEALNDPKRREQAKTDAQALMAALGNDEESPSHKAARHVLEIVAEAAAWP